MGPNHFFESMGERMRGGVQPSADYLFPGSRFGNTAGLRLLRRDLQRLLWAYRSRSRFSRNGRWDGAVVGDAFSHGSRWLCLCDYWRRRAGGLLQEGGKCHRNSEIEPWNLSWDADVATKGRYVESPAGLTSLSISPLASLVRS